MSILDQLNIQDPYGLGFGPSTNSLLASATSAGAIVGMLCFGFIADHLGGQLAVILTGILVISGSVGSSLCQRSDNFPLVSQLLICQVVLGVGIGGEYPLSATIASECSDPKIRTKIVGLVFSMQGFGMMESCLLTIIFLRAGVSLEVTCRLLLGLGSVRVFVAFCLRLKTPQKHVSSDQQTRSSAFSRIRLVWSPLLGCMLCWFLSDVTFNGTGRFKHAIQQSVYAPSESASEEVVNQAIFGLIITLIALPRYFLTALLGDRLGLGRIQIMGFLMMAIMFALIGLSVYLSAPSWLQVLLFGSTFLISNFRPNGSCHGIAAAAGKAGSVVGGAGFPPALEAVGLSNVMYICTGVALVGFITAAVFLPPKKVEMLRNQTHSVSITTSIKR
jgi:PHS family inorganic phosphate transporter-like MFS transporter